MAGTLGAGQVGHEVQDVGVPGVEKGQLAARRVIGLVPALPAGVGGREGELQVLPDGLQAKGLVSEGLGLLA